MIFFNEVTCDCKVKKRPSLAWNFHVFSPSQKNRVHWSKSGFLLLFARPKFLKGAGRNKQLVIRSEAMRRLEQIGHLHCVLSTCCHVVSFRERLKGNISNHPLKPRSCSSFLHGQLKMNGQNMESQQCGSSCLCGRQFSLGWWSRNSIGITPCKFNSSPLKISYPQREVSGAMLNFGAVNIIESYNMTLSDVVR